MRIVGGARKGLRLKVPKGTKVRPTPDRVREALFSMLGESAVDARVLDLYAGSGCLGLEALSRGARSAVFVERSRSVIEILRANVAGVAPEDADARVRMGDVRRVLSALQSEGALFDLVFLDPPYGRDLVGTTMEKLVELELLSPGAWVVVDHSSREEFEKNPIGRLVFVDRRAYGEVAIALYRYAAEEQE